MTPTIGTIYSLTENRGNAKVVEILERLRSGEARRVRVEWADGQRRKISVESLVAEADSMTNSPAPNPMAGRSNPSHIREVYRRSEAIKDARQEREEGR